MPFLLPPADFTEAELGELELSGTCEVQICRSCGPWSMATNTKIEHSVQNAYLKAIQLSEHFVYIENQFFITSTVVDGIQIENQIGDALVERIIKAYKEETPWRACIVIPLLPGYTYPIDSNEASSVRLILECQNRTISRGTHSIFSRLRKEGIDVSDLLITLTSAQRLHHLLLPPRLGQVQEWCAYDRAGVHPRQGGSSTTSADNRP